MTGNLAEPVDHFKLAQPTTARRPFLIRTARPLELDDRRVGARWLSHVVVECRA
jgi:hypothetical protein